MSTQQNATATTAVITTCDTPRRLSLVSYNIQVGIRTQSRAQNFRQSWRHFMPGSAGNIHLMPIARILRGHDLVAIQEADSGSFRTRSVNLLRFLADRADYPHWHIHGHRSLWPWANHGMGILSRYSLNAASTHALPGRIPGRAAVIYRLGSTPQNITIVITHLALGKQDRYRQLQRIQELVGDAKHVVLMGDLNCETQELKQHPWFRKAGFQPPAEDLPSYPSWQPQRQIDHILTTPGLPILSARVIPFCWSDHLPIHIEIALPPDISLHSATTKKPVASPATPLNDATKVA